MLSTPLVDGIRVNLSFVPHRIYGLLSLLSKVAGHEVTELIKLSLGADTVHRIQQFKLCQLTVRHLSYYLQVCSGQNYKINLMRERIIEKMFMIQNKKSIS